MRRFPSLVSAAILLACVSVWPQSAPSDVKQEVRTLIDGMAQSLGGWEKVRSVRAARVQQTVRTIFRTFQVDSVVLPDRLRQEDNLFGYVRATIVSPQVAITVAPGHPDYRLSPAEKESWSNNNFRFNIIYLLQQASNPAYEFSVLGSERIGEAQTRILEARAYGCRHWFYVEPQSGRVLREVQYDPDGGRASVDYSQFVSGEGFIFPAHGNGSIQDARGQTTMIEADITAVELNPRVDYRLFDRNGAYLAYSPIHPAPMLPAPEPQRTAALRLTTQPGNAQTYLNDEFRGTSSSDGNLAISNLKPGAYRLRVTLTGHKEWTQTVTLAPGDSRSVEARLESTGPKPLTEPEVEKLLREGVSKPRVATLVREYGVDFEFSDEVETRLRAAGADDAILLAVSKSRRR